MRLITLATMIVATIACGGGSSPTAPTPPPVVIVAPPVVVVPPVTPPVTPPPVAVPNPLLSDPRFSLAFYRQFARNGYEHPEALEPLRRQSEAPRIYLRTIDNAGAAMDALTLEQTASAIESTTGSLTGRFGLAGIERGKDSKRGQRGWITVEWESVPNPLACGSAVVGGDLITLYPKTPGCRCTGGPAVALSTVKHELGHALGYWHTDSRLDLMYYLLESCDAAPSDREKFHALVAYGQSIGSRDPS